MAKLPSGDELRREYYENADIETGDEDKQTIEEMAQDIAVYAAIHEISPYEAYTAVGVALAVATGLVEFTGREE